MRKIGFIDHYLSMYASRDPGDDRGYGGGDMKMLAMLVAAALAAACSEIPQDARKPFANAQETKAATASLDARAAVQDEYPRVGGAKP
jgi:hypothetical protein